MRILAFGDFHGKFPAKLKNLIKKEKFDLILCTGDYGGSDRLLKIIFKYFKQAWWEKVGAKKARELILEDYNSGKRILKKLNSLNKSIYTIFGNWDFIRQSEKERTAKLKLKMYPKIIGEYENLHYLKKRIRNIRGIKILAFGGIVTAGVYTTKESNFSKSQIERYKKKNKKETEQLMKYGNKKIDILLSHYSPYGYFDIVKFKGKNPMNGKHVGFKGYTDFIKKNKPALFICGHMHEYQGKKKFGKTLV